MPFCVCACVCICVWESLNHGWVQLKTLSFCIVKGQSQSLSVRTDRLFNYLRWPVSLPITLSLHVFLIQSTPCWNRDIQQANGLFISSVLSGLCWTRIHSASLVATFKSLSSRDKEVIFRFLWFSITFAFATYFCRFSKFFVHSFQAVSVNQPCINPFLHLSICHSAKRLIYPDW